MTLQSIYDTQAAYEMNKVISKISKSYYGQNGCKIRLSDDQEITVAKIIGTNWGTNGGKNGKWFYYGSITVLDEFGKSYTIDASRIKQVTRIKLPPTFATLRQHIDNISDN
jgi:hypothetical protein